MFLRKAAFSLILISPLLPGIALVWSILLLEGIPRDPWLPLDVGSPLPPASEPSRFGEGVLVVGLGLMVAGLAGTFALAGYLQKSGRDEKLMAKLGLKRSDFKWLDSGRLH